MNDIALTKAPMLAVPNEKTAKGLRVSNALNVGPVTLVAYAAALLCAFPIIAVIIAALAGNTATITRLGGSLLPAYALTTVTIMMFVALGTAVIGTVTAWLVTACEFPGRKLVEIALVLPLAFPAYVLAYAYTDLLDHPGWVQTSLRALFDWGPRDYWFPEVRSPGGAALMLTLVLYPYVYLLARTAFLMQGLGPFTVARSLGSSNQIAFWTISVPLVAPAISAGVLLALMETIADFGTVSHFGVQTLATGIYTTWFTLGDRAASAQMALGLLAIALFLFALEGLRAKGSDVVSQNANRDRWPRMRLSKGKGLVALAACSLPVLLGAVLPVIMLMSLAQRSEQQLFSERYWGFFSNSLTLGIVAAIATVALAVALSYSRRSSGDRKTIRASFTLARLGYAVPGAVIALGLFVPIASFENMIDRWARAELGFSTGLFLSGTIVVLVAAYVIRFMAAALGAWRAGEVTVTRDLDRAAEGLGASTGTILRRIHIPMLAPAAFTAMLLVFVDTIKELPATLIIRPFGWDTLAVQAYRLAADERLEGAAIPSLIIVAIGLLPVIILCRRLRMT
ncbi:MAG: iron ABC transporter permease [Pseudomonadota bacterium]